MNKEPLQPIFTQLHTDYRLYYQHQEDQLSITALPNHAMQKSYVLSSVSIFLA